MKTFHKRILMFSISLIVALSLTMSLCIPAMASPAPTNFVTVSKNKSFVKDGKFYMSFNLANTTNKTKDSYYGVSGGQGMILSGKVVNSSGKTIFKWDPDTYKAGVSKKRSFGANYSSLPSGKYTFILIATTTRAYGGRQLEWSWNYKITHKSSSAISFKSFEKIRDSKGVERQRFNIQCKGIKGKKLTMKIQNSDGEVVYSATGPARKTHNEVGWFSWDGWANVGSKYKCKSGQYHVEVFYTGSNKIIQKTYNLII